MYNPHTIQEQHGQRQRIYGTGDSCRQYIIIIIIIIIINEND